MQRLLYIIIIYDSYYVNFDVENYVLFIQT